MEEMKTPLHLDKQLIWSIAVGMLALGAGAFLYFGGAFQSNVGPGDCLVLPQEYCADGITLDYMGKRAIGFNLPENTKLYMPSYGVLLDDTPQEALIFTNISDENKETGKTNFIGLNGELAMPLANGVIKFVGYYQPYHSPTALREGGAHFADSVGGDTYIDEITESNFVLYIEEGVNPDYLSSLFPEF